MSGFELRLTVPGAFPAPEATAPERVTLWSCVGCGARGMPDVCTGACDDRPVEYVRAIDLDAVLAAARPLAGLGGALRELPAEVAGREPAGDEWEPSWRAWRDRARAVRAAWPETPRLPDAERIAGWWCGACGRIESPQPCLGVCTRRHDEWVRADRYDAARAHAEQAADAVAQLRPLAAQRAYATPRPGELERSGCALQERARALSA